MTINDLPEKLHLVGMRLPNKGTIYIQKVTGNKHSMLAWNTFQSAKDWLENGGLISWKNESNDVWSNWINMGGEVIIVPVSKDDFTFKCTDCILLDPVNGSYSVPIEQQVACERLYK